MTYRPPFRTGFFGPLTFPVLALLAAASGSGCAEEIRDFGAGGDGGAGGEPSTSSTSSGGAGGSGGVGGSGGSGGSGGVGGAPPLVCMPGQPAYGGALCGPPNMPCKLLADELLPSPPSFRNDAPSITSDGDCEPHIMYSVAEGGYHGFHARREAGGKFFADETPFEFATGGVAMGTDGILHVLAYGGAFNATMFRRSKDQWEMGTPLPGQNFAASRSLVRDGKGLFHVGAADKDYVALYATFDPATLGWSVLPLIKAGSSKTSIAVTQNGRAHLTYWSSVNSMWQLNWQSPPDAPEVALLLNSNSLGSASQLHSLAVTPDDNPDGPGAPHILTVRDKASGSGREIVYATRAAGQWLIDTIDQEKSSGTKFCNTQPTMPGQTCDYDYEEIYPVGIVASQGGDVSAVYNKVQRLGSVVSNCQDPMFCFWEASSDTSTGQIIIASYADGMPVGKASIGANVIIQSGTVALDTIGRIHMALYDRPPGQDGSTVRYLQVGP